MVYILVQGHVLHFPGKIMLVSSHSNTDQVFKSFVKSNISEKQTKQHNSPHKKEEKELHYKLFPSVNISAKSKAALKDSMPLQSALPAKRTHHRQNSSVQYRYDAVS